METQSGTQPSSSESDDAEGAARDAGRQADLSGMRVCALRLGQDMIVADTIPAFEELGAETLILDMTLEYVSEDGITRKRLMLDGEVDYLAALYLRIEEFDPHLIFLSDSSGLDREGLLYLIAELKEIPLVNWFVDDPYFFPAAHRDREARFACHAVFDPYYTRQMREEGYPNVFDLPLGVNPDRFADAETAPSATPKQTVAFVGSSGLGNIETVLKTIESTTVNLPDEAREIIDETIEAGAAYLQAHPERCAADFLEEHVAKRQGDTFFSDATIKPLIASIVDFRATFYRRRDIVNSVDYTDIALIGDSRWKGHTQPNVDLLPRVPYDKIGEVYRTTAININVSRYQLKQTVNQRVFDVPVAGGFLITDYRPGIEEFFEVGEEVVCYKDADDLKEKILHYRDRPEERAAIVARARERALREHTYTARVGRMLDSLRELKVAKGAVARGAVTERALPSTMKPRLLRLAAIFRERERFDESDLLVGKAQETIPSFIYDARAFAADLISAGLPEAAMMRLDAAVSENATAPLCVSAGMLARDLGLHQEAIKYAIRALEINPVEPDAGDLIKECFKIVNAADDDTAPPQ